MTTPQTLPHDQEDWTSADFVHAWLDRSAAGLPERQARFRLAGAMLAQQRDAAFTFLDLGAGAGPMTSVLLDRFPNSTAVVHDVSKPMLDRAAQELAAYGGRVKLVQADLAVPGWSAAFGGQKFQAAVSSIAIHNLFNAAQIANVYREAAGLLAPDGVFVNIDYVASEPSVIDSYRGATAQRREERGETPRPGMGGGAHFAGTLADHLRWLREGGFATADCPWRELNLTILLGKR